VSATTEPLIRDLPRWELTDQRIAGRTGSGASRPRGRSPSNRAAPLQLDMLFGSKSIFDFAELIKDTIPIDPVRTWPPGQMLEGVKLQRARGGCLGAKSR
jgi:hypothetical protein